MDNYMLIEREEIIQAVSAEDIGSYIEQLKKKYDVVSYNISCSVNRFIDQTTIRYWVKMKKKTTIEWLED